MPRLEVMKYRDIGDGGENGMDMALRLLKKSSAPRNLILSLDAIL